MIWRGAHMHLRLPKLLHAWREFAWEVFIIVVGVLIALGAQQAVEEVTWRQRVKEAKEDLRSELEDSLLSAQERVRAKECVDRKLARVSEMIEHPPAASSKWRGVAPLRLWSTSAWDSAIASGAVTHMSADERARYAQIYSGARALQAMNHEEFTASAELRMLERGGPISDVTQDRLRAIVAKLQGYNNLIMIEAGQLSDLIHTLGINLSAENETALKNKECTMPDDPGPVH